MSGKSHQSATATSAAEEEMLSELALESVATWFQLHRQPLEAEVHSALMNLIYDNRSYLRPSLLKSIAANEVNEVIQFCSSRDCAAVDALGRARARDGIGSGVLLNILRCIAQACQQQLKGEEVLAAISMLHNYEAVYLEAYIEAREAIILAEQEHIRSALQGSFNRYYTWLQTAAEVSKAVTSTLDLRQMITEAVTLIRTHFDHYHVALYVLDSSSKYAVLLSSSGRENQKIARQGQKVRVNDETLVGQCLATGEARTVANTKTDALQLDKTLLPETMSVMLLPLISRRRVIGVLSIQSTNASGFYDDDITRMQTVADQLANAVENARLYHELQTHSRNLAQAVELRTLELSKTTERVETILRNSPDAILLFNKDWRIELANPAAYTMFGYDAEMMPTASLRDLFSKTDNTTLQNLLDECVETGQSSLFAAIAERFDHITFNAGVSLAAIYEDHDVTGLVCIVRDITEQVQAEQQIKSSLHEKEVLLREIHHRVKNNMQVMSSLIALQSSYSDDDHVNQLFRESQSRIRSMALVHEQLYRSNDLAHIDFSKYMDDLTSNLMRSYQEASGRIQLQTHSDPIYLDIDTAIPCGLIINELVSNALKHAFPNGRSGAIDVVFQLGANNSLTLTVRDDGVGLPNHLNIEKTESLGLQLVSSLAAQLNATIGLRQEGGTTFEIRFLMPAQLATEIQSITRPFTGRLSLEHAVLA